MNNPEFQEKSLAPLDLKVKRKTSVQAAVIAVAIVSIVFLVAEFLYRVAAGLIE